MMCTVNQEAARLIRLMAAYRTRSSGAAEWPRTSTRPTAARLATHALRTIVSAVARLGSSAVACEAVSSADNGQITRHTQTVYTMAVTSHPAAGADSQLPKTTTSTTVTIPAAS